MNANTEGVTDGQIGLKFHGLDQIAAKNQRPLTLQAGPRDFPAAVSADFNRAANLTKQPTARTNLRR